MNEQLLIIFSAAAAAMAAYAIAGAVIGRGDSTRLRQRMVERGPDPSIDARRPGARQAVRAVLSRIGTAAAHPFMPRSREQMSLLRRQLGFAGIYAPAAVALMKGAKTICLSLGLVGGYVVGTLLGYPILGAALGGLLGYVGPTLWLRMKIRRNQHALTVGLPDALDLMVVCVESGLTIDAAMQRVGDEMIIAHPAISRELGITHMETRVGLPRSEALRNLGVRTANAALQSLAAMLVQADRFGTSIAQALRVHADTLRTQRQLQAEEQASKASVKLSFPLVLFIFPATFIVVLGPTIISLMNSSLMK